MGVPVSGVLVKDGRQIAILRPKNARAAIKAAEKAKTKDELYAVMTNQEHSFVGLAGDNGELLDPTTLRVIGRIQPGDSLVGWESLKASLAKREAEKCVDGLCPLPDTLPEGD